MLAPGDRIQDKYRVVRAIGEGGMGAVFECEHEAIRRRVAIKVLFPQFAVDPQAVLRFHREAQAAGRIGQDNICEVVDLGQLPDGAPYLVMPLLRGVPLSDLMRKEGPLELGRAVDLISQVLDALAAAHQAGIVHRDLKPDNLFVTRLGSRNIEFVKVLDFGISKIMGNTSVDENAQVTRTGMVMGTPCYMAPEQARGLKDVDHRADLYAVGTILYEMVAGRRPFDGESFNDILIRVVIDPVPPPRAIRPDLPPEIEAVILAAMDRDKLRRPQTADELRTRLQAAWKAVEGGAPARPAPVEPTQLAPAAASGAAPVAIPTPPPSPPSAMVSVGPVPSLSTISASVGDVGGESLVPPRSRKGLYAGIGVAVVLAAGIAVFVVARGSRTTATPPTPSPAAAATPGPSGNSALPVPPSPDRVVAVAPTPAVAEPTRPAVPEPAVPPTPLSAGSAASSATEVDAGAAAPATVRIDFSGVPAGAAIEVAGRRIDGTTAELPRSDEPIAVSITARGYEPFTTQLVPSEDRTVPVRLRRAGSGPAHVATTVPPPPPDAGATSPSGHDAGTVSGRLGTTLINIYGEDAP